MCLSGSVRRVANFVNEPVNAGSLPRLEHRSFVPVDPNWLKASLLSMATFAVVVAGIGIGATLLVAARSGPTWLPLTAMGVVLGLTALSAVLRIIEVRHIAYLVREHDISYRSGVLVRQVSTVPFVRVQHARIRQGPLQRRFGIASLEVNSAGPDLRIHGLPAITADALKVLVVDRAGDLVESP